MIINKHLKYLDYEHLKHFEKVVKLHVESLKINVPDYEINIKNIEDNFKKLDKNKDIIYIAEQDRNLIGFFWLKIFKGEIHLNQIVISKKFRNLGFGISFLQKIIAITKKLKKNEITLWTNKENKVATELYKKFGFKIIEEKEKRQKMQLNLNLT